MDVVVLSHLRWDFVYQRPQHLMTRAAGRHRVLFIEEPLSADTFAFQMRTDTSGVRVVQPLLPSGTPDPDAESWLRGALTDLVAEWRGAGWSSGTTRSWPSRSAAISRPRSRSSTAWISSARFAVRHQPFARAKTRSSVAPTLSSPGAGAFGRRSGACIRVFTVSRAASTFRTSRRPGWRSEPPALASIPHPRLVYAGVIDERIDLDLLHALADSGAGEVVLIGPVAKIDPADIPRGPHIHALGQRPYAELPSFFAHADLGLMPFALNEATRFISPTKTPEYLAAGHRSCRLRSPMSSAIGAGRGWSISRIGPISSRLPGMRLAPQGSPRRGSASRRALVGCHLGGDGSAHRRCRAHHGGGLTGRAWAGTGQPLIWPMFCTGRVRG